MLRASCFLVLFCQLLIFVLKSDHGPSWPSAKSVVRKKSVSLASLQNTYMYMDVLVLDHDTCLDLGT